MSDSKTGNSILNSKAKNVSQLNLIANMWLWLSAKLTKNKLETATSQLL